MCEPLNDGKNELSVPGEDFQVGQGEAVAMNLAAPSATSLPRVKGPGRPEWALRCPK